VGKAEANREGLHGKAYSSYGSTGGETGGGSSGEMVKRGAHGDDVVQANLNAMGSRWTDKVGVSTERGEAHATGNSYLGLQKCAHKKLNEGWLAIKVLKRRKGGEFKDDPETGTPV